MIMKGKTMTAKQEILNTVSTVPDTMSQVEILRLLIMHLEDKRAQDDLANGRVYCSADAKNFLREKIG
jgi:hypothetical protein